MFSKSSLLLISVLLIISVIEISGHSNSSISYEKLAFRFTENFNQFDKGEFSGIAFSPII